METINNKTGMAHAEAREFIRNHFEEFINRKNVQIWNVNFAADFVDHGADVPPGMPPGPAGAIQYVSKALQRFPDLHVQIEDMIAEDDKVVVRNRWVATDSLTGKKQTKPVRVLVQHRARLNPFWHSFGTVEAKEQRKR